MKRRPEKAIIRQAQAPVPVMKKSMAAPSTVAYVMQEKFQNGVPLYRQEAYWKGQGVELRRNTMANWVIRSARWFKPLYELLRKELLRQDIVNVDETRVHVLKEDGRESKQMSQMWVFCSAEKKIALYQYSPSRSGRVAKGDAAGLLRLHPDRRLFGLPLSGFSDPCGLLGPCKAQVGGLLCGW